MNDDANDFPLPAAPSGAAIGDATAGFSRGVFPEMSRALSLLRFPSSLGIALVVNALLLIFVIRLVTGEREKLERASEDITVIDFVRLIKDSEPVQRNRRQELPELVEQIQPPVPQEQPKEVEPPPEPEVRMITPELAPPLNLTDAPTLPAVTPPKEAPKAVEAPLAVQTTPAPPAKPAPPPKPAGSPNGAAGGSDEPVFDSALQAISKPDPKYPPRALRSGTEGVVTIEFIVTPEGRVRDPKIISAKPPGIFDDAAKEGVLRWKFKPKIVDGKSITRRARLDINFKLKKG
jgi:protein TonB